MEPQEGVVGTSDCMADQSETQVTTWTCSWLLKYGASLWDWALYCGILFYLQVRQCQNWVELQDTLLPSTTCLLVWGSLQGLWMELGPETIFIYCTEFEAVVNTLSDHRTLFCLITYPFTQIRYTINSTTWKYKNKRTHHWGDHLTFLGLRFLI